jgi:hypothetical protein
MKVDCLLVLQPLLFLLCILDVHIDLKFSARQLSPLKYNIAPYENT